MFAGVKFQSDNTVGVVPINYVKNFKLPVDVNKSYEVFWSKDPNEEPNSKHKNVDKIYKCLGSKKDKKESLPPSGYYNAKILCIADTFDETNESLNGLGLPIEKKNVESISRTSTNKLISSAASSLIRASIIENSLEFTDDEDDTDADETVEPVRKYKEKLKYMESQNLKLENDVKTLKSQLLTTKEQLKKSEDETKKVSEKLMQKKRKYRAIEEEFKTARQLNYELQKKLIGSFNVIVSPNSNVSNYEQHSSTSEREPSSPSLISSNSCKMKQPNISIVDQCQQSENSKPTNYTDMSHLDETQDIIFETAEIEKPAEDCLKSKDVNLFLSDAIIQSSSMGCRNGKDGDKVYVKNLAVNMFGKDVLMNSSATGRKPPTGGQSARPALPKAGIVYIRNLLEQSDSKSVKQTFFWLCELNQKKDLTEDEKKLIVDQRSSFVIVIQAIGDKISSLRRSNK